MWDYYSPSTLKGPSVLMGLPPGGTLAHTSLGPTIIPHVTHPPFHCAPITRFWLWGPPLMHPPRLCHVGASHAPAPRSTTQNVGTHVKGLFAHICTSQDPRSSSYATFNAPTLSLYTYCPVLAIGSTTYAFAPTLPCRPTIREAR